MTKRLGLDLGEELFYFLAVGEGRKESSLLAFIMRSVALMSSLNHCYTLETQLHSLSRPLLNWGIYREPWSLSVGGVLPVFEAEKG